MSFEVEVLQQLRSVNARWEATRVVIADYQVAHQRSLELELRVAQLTKENEELRDECDAKEATIETLTQKIASAHEDLRKALEAERKENIALGVEKQSLEESLQTEKEARVQGDARIEELEAESTRLQSDLTQANQATALAVSEMQTSKQETDEARKDQRRLDAENYKLIEKIKTDQIALHDKWQEVTDMEAMVQNCKTEVEHMRAQLMAERELEQEPGLSLIPWKRRPNPYAKRISACARLMEKNEPEKALQALDVLLIEMKDRQREGLTTRPRNRSESGFEVVPGEDEQPWADSGIELPTRPEIGPTQHRGGCNSCTSNDFGTLVATGGADGHVLIWDVSTMTVQNTFVGMAQGTRDVSIVSDGSSVLAAGADKTIRIWKMSNGDSSVMTGHSKSVNCVACDPGNVNRAISCGEDRHIRFWDVQRGYQLNKQIGLTEWTNTVCYSHGGNFIVSGHSRGGLKLWDERSDASMPVLEHQLHQEAIVGLCPYPLSSHLLLTVGRDNQLKLLDIRTTDVLHTFKDPRFTTGTVGYTGGAKCSIDISRNEQWIAVGSSRGDVMLWKADGSRPTSAEYLKCETHKEAVVATAWANERCFSCDRAGNVVIWR